MRKKDGKSRPIRPARVLACGYAALIALGTLLLMLPAATTAPGGAGALDALFTATSATCVTGLSVLDTGRDFTSFGHAVLLFLIQVGGLGFMLFATLLFLALRKRIPLQGRMLIKESVGAQGLSGVVRAMLHMGLITLLVEGAGCALLSVRFVPEFGLGRGLWYGLFHSVSAFCNAGFDLFGDYASLARYAGDAYLQTVIMLLIILGGLGYAVLEDAFGAARRARRLSLHSRITLYTTAFLLVLGFLLMLLLEWNNGSRSIGQRVLDALFQSVTTRTAGFTAIDQGKLTDGGKLTSVLLMFIGASPASTGGGTKTTTVCILFLVALATVRGQRDVNAFGRRLPLTLVRTAICILLANMLLLIAGTIALSVTEAERGFSLIDLMYETVSALSTVGLTALGTPKMSGAGRAIMILYMYIGRVGPMTIMLTLAKGGQGSAQVTYPEEHLIIG